MASIRSLKVICFSLVLMFFCENAYSHNRDYYSANVAFAPIVLSVTPVSFSGFSFSIADLEWNPYDPLLPGNFYVERLENLVWNPIKKIRFNPTFTKYVYSDTISSPFCVNSPDPFYNISYRIRFETDDAVPVIYFSNIETDGPFADNTKPSDVGNNIVSIITYTDPLGTIVSSPVIQWTPSRSNDIASYRIDRALPGAQYYPVITVPAANTQYIDKNITDVCQKSYAYAVVALDKCGNPSPGTYGTPPMQTILLTMDAIDPCDRKANLYWNKYNNMPGGLGGYNVYRDDNYTGPVLFDVIQDTTVTRYSDSYSFQNGHTYTYRIEAFSKNKLFLSSSCSLGTKYQGANLSDTVYITQASVENDQFIKVDYFYEPQNTISELQLQRSNSQSGPWTSIDTLHAPAGSFLSQYGSINDLTAEVHSENYFYRLLVIDACNTIPVSSINTANPILLQQEFSETENKIFWNTYSTWLKGVSSYDIYRQEGGVAGTLPIAVVSSSSGSYSEPASVVAPGVEVCYWVVAHENKDNTYFPGSASKSNICCILKEPSFVMPTAFNPSSKTNNRLRPVTAYVDPQGFKMNIFDRWGQQIFVTDNMYSGWDGLFNGQYAQAGLYSYIVTYKSIDGKEYLKRGTTLLIR